MLYLNAFDHKIRSSIGPQGATHFHFVLSTWFCLVWSWVSILTGKMFGDLVFDDLVCTCAQTFPCFNFVSHDCDWILLKNTCNLLVGIFFELNTQLKMLPFAISIIAGLATCKDICFKNIQLLKLNCSTKCGGTIECFSADKGILTFPSYKIYRNNVSKLILFTVNIFVFICSNLWKNLIVFAAWSLVNIKRHSSSNVYGIKLRREFI